MALNKQIFENPLNCDDSLIMRTCVYGGRVAYK